MKAKWLYFLVKSNHVYIFALVIDGFSNMKRFFGFVFSIIVLLGSMSSCVTMSLISAHKQAKTERIITGSDFGAQTAEMQLRLFQRVSEYAALATTGRGEVVCVVSFSVKEYYDGKSISGKYIRNGTYNYEAVSGAYKQVLIYVDKTGYEFLEQHAKQALQR